MSDIKIDPLDRLLAEIVTHIVYDRKERWLIEEWKNYLAAKSIPEDHEINDQLELDKW